MPAETTVKKDELLDVLMTNREKHRTTYLAAKEGRKKQLIAKLSAMLENARAGRKVEDYIDLPEPEDHTHDYDREIRMLQMEVDDEVVLTSRLFDNLVMDDWGWSDDFRKMSFSYSQ
jgi:hypothetical protein